MFKQGVGDFKYYVGINSLSQIATRQDRVCVLNITGGESKDVTPVGHVCVWMRSCLRGSTSRMRAARRSR